MSFHTKAKWVVGLTGSILSGKSTALAYFAQAGAKTISCDEITQQLYRQPSVIRSVKKLLGTTDSAEISRQIFKNKKKRAALEKILHPLIFKEVKAQIKSAAQPLVVLEAPLLFEAGWDSWTDLNIVVVADDRTLPARLKGRKMSRTEYAKRLKTQWPQQKKVLYADVVFFHRNKVQLKQRVSRFCHVFKVLHNQ